jgi:hypothetical protein
MLACMKHLHLRAAAVAQHGLPNCEDARARPAPCPRPLPCPLPAISSHPPVPFHCPSIALHKLLKFSVPLSSWPWQATTTMWAAASCTTPSPCTQSWQVVAQRKTLLPAGASLLALPTSTGQHRLRQYNTGRSHTRLYSWRRRMRAVAGQRPAVCTPCLGVSSFTTPCLADFPWPPCALPARLPTCRPPVLHQHGLPICDLPPLELGEQRRRRCRP